MTIVIVLGYTWAMGYIMVVEILWMMYGFLLQILHE